MYGFWHTGASFSVMFLACLVLLLFVFYPKRVIQGMGWEQEQDDTAQYSTVKTTRLRGFTIGNHEKLEGAY